MTLDHPRYPILYVDDDRANLLAFCYALERHFWVITAESGEEALRRLVEEDVAVLVADQRMPGMTGVEVCARAREVKPSVVRMILTAYADLDAAKDAINLGHVARYITKPWKEEELVTILRTGIEVFHLRRVVAEMELKVLRGERQGAALAVTAELDHELRQRFAVLTLNADTLTRLAGEVAKAHVAGQLREIAEDTRTVVEHISDLLGRLRAGAGSVDEPAEADAARVIDMAIGLMRSEMVRVAVPDVLLEARATLALAPTELAQILLNLLTNACQALPKDEPHRHRIAVRLGVDDDRALLSVSDSGPGIPPDELEKVFQAYYTTKPEGTGLGLTIVKQIVDRRGGEIRLESVVGRGTTVRLSLPLVRGSVGRGKGAC